MGVKRVAVKDIRRLEAAVCALEAQQVTPGGIVLYGSSTVARWPRERLTAALHPVPVTVRGFGGSTAEEAYFYYPRLVRPCAPKVLALYTGDNDPLHGYSPERAFLLTEWLLRAARSDFPALQVLLIGVKPVMGQADENRLRLRYNRLLRQWVDRRPFAAYVDLPQLVQKPDGTPNPEAYQADGDHLSPLGYERLTAALAEGLTSVHQKAAAFRC